MVKVKKATLIYDNIGIDAITCDLGNNRFFDIEISEFYFTLLDTDKNLLSYSKKFENWDELTNDLLTLGFPFEYYCEEYINTQFTDSEIEEFTYQYQQL